MKMKFETTHQKSRPMSGVQAALDRIPWSLRESRLKAGDGQVLHEVLAVEAPAAWSDQAVNIVARQYFRKSLPDGSSETSARKMIERVVESIGAFASDRLQYFATSDDAENFKEQVADLVVRQKASFNSPVWFNCGLWQSYQVVGNPGNWAWDFSSHQAVPIQNGYERPQSSACFIQSIEDDLNSIFDLVKKEARLFKYGSGSGTNFSKIRGRQERLSGGGASSGLLSFLEVFDRAAGATKSGGTTRRAAKMVCLDMDHPEIFDFIRWKAKEESKAQALMAAGFSSGMDGDAYHTVSGQNSNNSVRATDAFFHAVKNDGDWATRARTSGVVIEKFKARRLLRAMAESAWVCADPGIQYEDAIQSWHTCKSTGPIRASNPCSEFMFLDDTACNLASLNLAKFVADDGRFLVEDFQKSIRALIVAQDTLVDFASYPSREIAENSHRFRPLGLGFANLGATLMALGLPYDSDVSRSWAAAVTALMTADAYLTSSELAECFGPFEGYKTNRDQMLEVIERHMESLEQIDFSGNESIAVMTQAARISWLKVLERGRKYGFRNSQVTVLAPTGTIAFMMDCDTTGIEPDFALVKNKTLSGGGELRIVNRSVGLALSRLGYDSKVIEKIKEKIEAGLSMSEAGLHAEHETVFDGASQISPEAHLKMMAAVQPFLSGAISKTVNLPSSASVEDIEKVFVKGWELGLKAVAVYRDQSKSAQPLKTQRHLNSTETVVIDSRNFGLCPVCSHPTVVSGTCWVCPECGHSIACS